MIDKVIKECLQRKKEEERKMVQAAADRHRKEKWKREAKNFHDSIHNHNSHK